MYDYEKRIQEYLRMKNRQEAIEDLKRYYDEGYRYVVRDAESEWLCLFTLKPKKYLDLESWGYVNENLPQAKMCKTIKNEDITEIRWQNRSATVISEFVKGDELDFG